MSEVYGPGHIFVPRAHDAACEWLPRGACVLDSLTGNQLTIAGDMQVVCSAGFNTAAGLDLLALAGLEPAPARIHFRAGESLEAVARAVEPSGDRLVLQHAFPPGAWQSERCWIDPDLLSYLNNKASLSALSPADHIPERTIVCPADLFAADPPSLPVVLKAATDQSCGGGSGVAICRAADDFDRARHLFRECDRIVVEAMLDIVRNPCLHFAVISADDVRYLGFADQDVDSQGNHRGNWLDLGSSLPRAIIAPAAEVVERAAALGYRGFAGVDMALTADDRIYVIDLNFRLNASTAAVVLAQSLKARFGIVTLNARRLQGCGSAGDFARSLEPWVRRGELVPLSFFDAGAADYPAEPPVVNALFVGNSRPAIIATLADLAAAGVVRPGANPAD